MRRRSTRGRRDGDPSSAVAGAAGPPSLPGYTDLRVIGHGASSTVYRATQDGYDREVAVKVLNIDVSDRRAQRRFTRERALGGRLSHHPNVVTVLDSGFVDGRYPFLAMELYEHGSLSDRLADRGPFDVALALQIGVRIAGALETAHRIGVLHRDVKPQNILLSRYGEPALADFGIAAILEMEHSVTAGLTPVHAAPEILEGADPTPQADVYALGSTIYTVLAGVAPFAGPPGEGMLAQLLRITTADLPAMPRADVPDQVVDLLRWATAKHLDERAPSAAAFGAALQRVQGELGLAVSALPVETADELVADVPAPAPAPPPDGPPPAVEPPPAAAVDDTVDSIPVAAPPPAVAPEPAAVESVASPHRDVTVSAPVLDEPTVHGRHHAPAATVQPSGRRRGRALLVGAVAVVAGAAAAFVVVGRDDGETTTTSSPSTVVTTDAAPTSPPGTIDPAEVAPTGFAVSVDTGAVVLTWNDESGGTQPQLIEVRTLEDQSFTAVGPGTEIHTVEGFDPTTPACFRVLVVLSMDSPEAVTANSPWECIGGATPVTAEPTTTTT